MFEHIKFIEKDHIYWIKDKQLVSVTQYIQKFQKPFEKDYWSKKKADERGISQKEILEEWAEKGKIAMDKGTMVHSYIEKILKGEGRFPPKTAIDETDIFDLFWYQKKKYLKNIVIEQRIGDEELGIGGTIDSIFFDMRTEKFHIYDWKTGKFSINNPFGQYLLAPFDNLPDSKLHYYSLQLSLYQLILKRNTDFDLGVPHIVHLSSKGELTDYLAIDCSQLLKEGLLKNAYF